MSGDKMTIYNYMLRLNKIANGYVDPITKTSIAPNRRLRNFLTHHTINRMVAGVPIWRRLATFYSSGPGSKGRGHGRPFKGPAYLQ